MRRLFLLAALGALIAYAQDGNPGQIVTQDEGAPPVGYEQVLAYSGTNLASVCISPGNVAAPSRRANIKVSISAVSKANPAVVTSTGHGFAISSRPKVTIVGATGTGWTGINATWTATVIDANTFSIPIDSSGFGTLAGTVTFTTTAPRSTVAEWAVKKLAYDGSNNLIWVGWLQGSSKYQAKCSDAASTAVNQQ